MEAGALNREPLGASAIQTIVDEVQNLLEHLLGS
jgi:hypothetical protein